jgi:hypothetical protein
MTCSPTWASTLLHYAIEDGSSKDGDYARGMSALAPHALKDPEAAARAKEEKPKGKRRARKPKD